MDDDALIARAISGDRVAYRTIMERYRSSVYHGAYRFVRDEDLAEDIVQEVFIAAFESLPSFRGTARFSTWLYRIMVTRSLNAVQQIHRKKRFAGWLLRFDDPSVSERAPAPHSDRPDERMERTERNELLRSALARLPQHQQAAIALTAQQGFSYEEAAEILNTTVPAVESLVFRGKKRLKQILSESIQDPVKGNEQ